VHFGRKGGSPLRARQRQGSSGSRSAPSWSATSRTRTGPSSTWRGVPAQQHPAAWDRPGARHPGQRTTARGRL